MPPNSTLNLILRCSPSGFMPISITVISTLMKPRARWLNCAMWMCKEHTRFCARSSTVTVKMHLKGAQPGLLVVDPQAGDDVVEHLECIRPRSRCGLPGSVLVWLAHNAVPHSFGTTLSCKKWAYRYLKSF